ncbi:MAG: choice-of-anchor Q domain-containing protein [Verrucomicrobiota bacterium]
MPKASITSAIMAATIVFAVIGGVFAGTTNTIPYSDNFENYANGTPLIDGTNGWYGDSSAIIVQTNTVRAGTNAAMIPEECTLSNRFESTVPTNVWIQMDLRPCLYDLTNHPMVDTNVAVMFYINTSGNFVVHNGPATNPSPTNSQSWVMVPSFAIATNVPTWVRINIYEDFANTNWSLYADGVLVTNNIGFININLTNFVGFDVYNGATTSYLDNVSVTVPATNTQPPLVVVPSALSQSLYAHTLESVYPLVQTVKVINVWSEDIGFRVATNQDWVTTTVVNAAGDVSPTAVVPHNSTNYLKLTFADVQGWGAGVSNATIMVVATNDTPAEWGTQTVQVALNMIALSNVLNVTPTQFSNSVWKGATPTNRTFVVRNLYDMNDSFDYRVTTGASWIASSLSAGTLGAYAETNLTLTNTESTAGWDVGLSNTWVDVVASNNGVLVTQRVDVWVNVVDISNVLEVTPASFSNTVWRGATPTNQAFIVSNKSDASFVYDVATGAAWIACSTTGGTLAAQSGIVVTQTYGNTLLWSGSGSSSWVKVASAGTTQDVTVTVNVDDISNVLTVTPMSFANTIWIGDTPTQQTFTVNNGSDASLVYQVSTTEAWIACSTTGGTLAAQGTHTVTNTYSATWDWTAGLSNATAIVSSAEGCGVTQLVAVALTVQPAATNYYVATNGGNVFPYTNWLDAANNLTSAVDKANFYTNVGSVVWISNGVYNLPGEVTLSNVTVRSVNGAGSVMLNGGGFRGFNLVHTGATLNGLTITNCIAGDETNGGAVFVSTGLVVNCRLLNNAATNGGGAAVGAGGVVRNCLIWGNTATNGGGVYYDMAGMIGGSNGIVESCTIASNYAVQSGGGLYTSTNMTGLCVNAVVYQNSAGGAYSNWGTAGNAIMIFSNACMAPTNGAYGLNNITNAPLFANVITGNCRLSQGSPCINTGTNQAWMTNAVDLDGNPRIVGLSVDMGAYETPLSWIITPSALTNQVMIGLLPTNQSFVISNQGADTLYFTVTNTEWLSDTSTNGALEPYSNSAIAVHFASSITNWPGSASNSTITVVVTNSLSTMYPAQTGTVTVTMNVMDLQVAPTNLVLTNGFMYSNSLAISSQTFSVWNAGSGTFSYVAQQQGDTTNWLSLSTNAGVAGSNTITVQYATNMSPGIYTETVNVASSEGGGATDCVSVAATIVARPVLGLTPSCVTQTMARGAYPITNHFSIWNGSTSPVVPMAYTLTISNGSPELIQSLLDSGAGVSSGQMNSVMINYMDISDATAGVYTAWVQIAAWDAGSTYAPTGTVQLSTTVVVQVTVTALDAPTGVTASDGTFTNQVVVDWNPVANAYNYIIYRSTTFDSSMAEPIGGSVGTSFNDLTGMAGMRYYYWVSSVNSDGGEGAKSTNRETGYRALSAPGGIFATDGAYTNKVRVTWPLVDGATGYQLYRGVAGDTLAPIYFTADGVFNDVSVLGGVHYEYKVMATNGVFGSALSVGDTGYAFGSPGGLTASDGTYVGKVRVTWHAVESALEYEVWRSARAVLPLTPGGAAVKLTTVLAPMYDDTSVSAGTMYYYWVRANSLADGWTNGCWSEMDRGYGASSGVDLWVKDLVVLPVQVGLSGSPVIVSFRMGNSGGTNMAGANGTVGMEFFASTNQVLGAGSEILIGKVVSEITLGVGQDMVIKVAGSQLVAPATEGDYYIFVRVLPEFPSLLADTNPDDNVAMRNGSVRVRSSGALNYQAFNDYDGDGMSDLGVYRGMEWSIRSVDERVLVSKFNVFSGAGRPVLGDLDGDRQSDPMVHDSASGIWQVLLSGSGYKWVSGVFGISGYRGLVADYEGLGHGDASVFHEGNGRWCVLTKDGGLTEWNWGEAGYVPVIGDYDGDGRWDMAVYQEATGLWYIRTLNGQLLVSGAPFGWPGCSPVAGDYDGDGCWDVAIYARATGKWYIVALDGRVLGWEIAWGDLGFEPVMGDYDGDGKWDLGVYHETTGLWYIRTLDGNILAWASQWGGPGYRPIGN